MAFVYEVNGQRVEFEKEPTEKDIDEAARSLGTKPKSQMPKPVEGEGGAAFGVYRPAGRRPESQQNREASADMALQTARGVASNIPALAGIPGSIANAVANAPRTKQDISNRFEIAKSAFTGQEPQTQPLPEQKQVTPYDMNYFASLTPGPQPSSPAGQLAFGAGQAVGAPIVPPALKAMKPAYELGKDAAQLALHPIQTAKTGSEAFIRGYRNPEMMGQQGSAMMPIRETYFPESQVKEYQAGTRPATQMTESPTSELIKTPVQQWAQNMAPVNAEGQALVAPKGKGFEGYMESLGAGYKQNPTQQIIDAVTGVGGMALTGGIPTPGVALTKSIPALAARTLQKATGFEPGFEASAVHAQQARSALEAGQPPTQNLLPAPGPVQPTMFASRTGEVTGPGGTPLPTQASGKPVAQPVMPSGSPKEVSQQMAMDKLQENWTQRSGGGYQPPSTPAPEVQAPAIKPQSTPVEPTPLPQQALNVPTEAKPTTIKEKLIEKYGDENSIRDKATTVELASLKQEMYPEKHATVTLKGSKSQINKGLLEAEQSGIPFRVTVNGPNGGYQMIYNSESFSFAGDKSLKINKAKMASKDEIDFSGTTKDGEPFTAETRGKSTTIKDSSGNVIAKYEGSKSVPIEEPATTPTTKQPKNALEMKVGAPEDKSSLGKALVNKRSFNGDLQKYRYGSEKNPLTVQEYEHLVDSDFIAHQNTRDTIMGMNPKHTEYSIWVKGKDGKVQNIQASSDDFN